MPQDASGRAEQETSYRRGWQQGFSEASEIVLRLVELGYERRKIRQLLAIYDDFFSVPGALLAIWSGGSPSRSSTSSACKPSPPRSGDMTGCSTNPESGRAVLAEMPQPVVGPQGQCVHSFVH
jgi:hypothetical protein